jgi:disease resistance protein RPS2
MVMQNHPVLNYVEKLDDGRFNCLFCGYYIAAEASDSRIKWHFSGEKGHGVPICDKVPEDVRGAVQFMLAHPIPPRVPICQNMIRDYL